MSEAERTPPSRRCGRPGRRRLPTPERLERQRQSRRAWADRNREYLREVWRARHLDPEFRAKRRRRWAEGRQARLEAAAEPPRPVGRPRLYTPEEARERKLACMRACAARSRQRKRAAKQATEDDLEKKSRP